MDDYRERIDYRKWTPRQLLWNLELKHSNQSDLEREEKIRNELAIVRRMEQLEMAQGPCDEVERLREGRKSLNRDNLFRGMSIDSIIERSIVLGFLLQPEDAVVTEIDWTQDWEVCVCVYDFKGDRYVCHLIVK